MSRLVCMYLIGLTGGIAAGKSTVAKEWASLGGIEIDADELAREALADNSEELSKVKEIFGDEVFDGKTLDRKALAQVIFGDPEKRIALESIVHPKVKQLAKQRFSELPADSIVIYNVPLLVEASVDNDFDLVVTVEAPRDKQIERLVKHRGLTEEQATLRIDSQATPAQRANAADEILNSNQPIEALLKDARQLWSKIERLAETNASN
ncbi:MAG: dephospho-CoA kinase [Actinobacteria bacterium]|nr:dephospho-CoA kinase [Actinomycetota bacterium]